MLHDNKLVLRPIFKPLVCLAGFIPIYLFFVAWGTGFVGGFGAMLLGALGFPARYSLLAAFLFFSIIVPLIVLSVLRKTYEKTTYCFSSNRLDYAEGFWTLEEKTIDLKNVIEVSLRKGIMQRRNNLGTITLSTQASGKSGISLFDITNPDQVYSEIKERIAHAKELKTVA